ncbi:DUF983 domain-containing protein [Brevundimonas sp.]|jgi:uncharacterized protein (DUF983 family)|uniref:DUF983 domain-containing protein n=1 Tax=Brevundimonas sp. TaxID=1871086 RepID=UPI0035AFD13B
MEFPRLSTLKTGLACRCPRCGKGPLFKGYLSLRPSCPVCGLDYGFADPADGPAFFVMSGAGLIGMVFMMVFEFTVHPPVWVHAIVTLPLLVALCLGSLRPFKSWLIAEQYVHKAAEPTFESVGKHGD